jgi:hypothetical protein
MTILEYGAVNGGIMIIVEARTSETSVHFYETTRRHTSEGYRLQP